MEEQGSKFRKNIFVTQINQQNDYSDYRAVPIVKDTADKLLLTGKNTYQHTLLLRKELEVEEVDAQLAAKREEFAAKLASCSRRHHDILLKQQALREQTKDAGAIIQDQNIKQRRALRRCEADAQERMRLEEDLNQLNGIASSELFRRHHLKTKLTRYRKDADFLLEVVNALPSDYITQRDDPLQGIMDRHAHLVKTEQQLTSHVFGLSEELKSANDIMRHAEVNHGFDLLELNGKLEHYRNQYEQLKSINSHLEAEVGFAFNDHNNRMVAAGNALRAIDGLVERCGGTALVMARGKEELTETGKRTFERKSKKQEKKKRHSVSQQAQRPAAKTYGTTYEINSLDVLFTGIQVTTQAQKDIAEEGGKYLLASRESSQSAKSSHV